ncbi:MAG: 1,4-dihydroxy-6-naphthoate synthase, partial [Candidatus Eremiobacteraeota bacterium]|nr:1,4-dihydroxy-6-naphthoate synthase [Candidatus Eremiobacteraeota bacterium]
DLVKVSYGAIPYLADKYRILRAGGALGRACGPLLVARPDRAPPLFTDMIRRQIAIPGERTTAFLLLQLALERRPKTVTMRFDKIVDAVAGGEIDAGLIIHESRFTYREAGLISIADLGEWWETHSLLPIPLGAILVRKDIPLDEALAIDDAIRRSVRFARANEDRVMPYVREHAVETSDDVMRSHIDLYVNTFTDDIGVEGIEAVHSLFSRARDAGIVPRSVEPEFV